MTDAARYRVRETLRDGTASRRSRPDALRTARPTERRSLALATTESRNGTVIDVTMRLPPETAPQVRGDT